MLHEQVNAYFKDIAHRFCIYAETFDKYTIKFTFYEFQDNTHLDITELPKSGVDPINVCNTVPKKLIESMSEEEYEIHLENAFLLFYQELKKRDKK